VREHNSERGSESAKELFSTIGLDHLLKDWKVLYPDDFINDIYTCDINTQLIEDSLNKKRKVFLWLAQDPFRNKFIQKLSEKINHYADKVKIVSGNIYNLWDDTEILYFPHFYTSQLLLRNHQTSATKKFRLGYLSYQPRLHRLFLMHKISPVIDNSTDIVSVSLPNLTNNTKTYLENECISNGILLSDILGNVPYTTKNATQTDEFFRKNDHTNKHNAYDCLFHLAGETDCSSDTVWLSEKTWKSIRSKCLTINYGDSGVPTCLQKLGFHVDTRYDPSLEWFNKAEWIRDFFAEHDYDQCKKIYIDNYLDICYNFEYFNSETLKNVFQKKFLWKI
jgi:hypothetical protein